MTVKRIHFIYEFPNQHIMICIMKLCAKDFANKLNCERYVTGYAMKQF